MFKISELLKYDGIVIQCHDDPDADAIASAFAVYTYLENNNKKAKIIYSGVREITKINLVEMIEQLSIPIEYSAEIPHIKTLVTVDCQYGERNVTKFTADAVVVIDHHEEKIKPGYLGVINRLGSCSTLVWSLLAKEHFEFEKYPDVSTALYYGLYTDTNNLEEIAHPLDKDMRDSLGFDQNMIKWLRNNNLVLPELNIAGKALISYSINRSLSYAVFKAEECDPNILGFTSDLALQVSGINVCVVYNEQKGGFKFSVRSCVKEVMADDFIEFLTEGVGSGGGHISKAGGFIEKTALKALYNINISIDEYIEKRINEYFAGYDIVYSENHNLNTADMAVYKKKQIDLGYVLSTGIFPEKTPILIRTLEGDAETEADGGIYIMIGAAGEIYSIKADKFNASYAAGSGVYEADFFELPDIKKYSPTVKNKQTGETAGISELLKLAKPCRPTGNIPIYAKQLTKHTKVFNSWTKDGYMKGKPNDYIAVRKDDENDVYIIKNDIFKLTYELQE